MNTEDCINSAAEILFKAKKDFESATQTARDLVKDPKDWRISDDNFKEAQARRMFLEQREKS